MNWFFETYLPGIVIYIVLPMIAGIAYACALQFVYRTRLLRNQASKLEESILAAEEAIVAEQQADEKNAEKVVEDIVEDVVEEVVVENVVDDVVEEVAQVIEQVIEPVIDEKESEEESKEDSEAVLIGAGAIDEMFSGDAERPETLPDFTTRESTSEEIRDALEFFQNQEPVAIDSLQTMLEADISDTANTSPASEVVSVSEVSDPFGEDLAETILGMNFNLDTLDKSAVIDTIAAPTIPPLDSILPSQSG